jgi:DNA-binding transcriptional MerR regulator
MSTLQQIAQADPQWSLEEFVTVANEFLPQFLPQVDLASRVQETVNPRLVRHYTTQGVLDKPLKQGREARYVYRHLLQLLLLRRLLSEGYSAGSLLHLTVGKADQELESLLLGGAQLTVQSANPALAFLAQVRDRTLLNSLSKKAAPVPPPAAGPPPAPHLLRSPSRDLSGDLPSDPSSDPSSHELSEVSPDPWESPALEMVALEASTPMSPPAQWTRLEVLPGLELHVRSDFAYPGSPHEQDTLLQLIAHHLISLTRHRR